MSGHSDHDELVSANELARALNELFGWDTGYLDDGFEIEIVGLGKVAAENISLGYHGDRLTITADKWRRAA